MAVSLNIANSVKTLNPVPLDYWYGNYSTVAEAIATIPIGKRFDGLTVKIVNDGEYWWLENDLSDNGLILKTNINTNSTSFYIYIQTTPATTWNITHNLGRNAKAVITNNAGIEFEGQIIHNSINQLTITFNTALSGKATLT